METNFIRKMKFLKEFRCFEKNFMIEFNAGINLLVGEQGTGKSSLFYAVLNWAESGIAMEYDKDKGYLFLDTETMNPRRNDSFKVGRTFNTVTDFDNAALEHMKDKFLNEYDYKSHGEVMLSVLLSNSDVKNKTIFIDEPEAGLSIRSQHRILEHYKKLAENNQLIIATHSHVLINNIERVYSMEHRKWMQNTRFLYSQLSAQVPYVKKKRIKKIKNG